jgi:hypothetical protein
MKKVIINGNVIELTNPLINTKLEENEKKHILELMGKGSTPSEMISYIENETLNKSLQSFRFKKNNNNQVISVDFLQHKEVWQLNSDKFVILDGRYQIVDKMAVIDYMQTFMEDEKIIDLLKLE